MKTDILTEIVAHKRLEVQAQKAVVPYAQLERMVDETASALSLSHALADSDTGIIAEFKRRSPSKGWFGQEADVATVVTGYVQAGAAGLSVLTDEAYFELDYVDDYADMVGVNNRHLGTFHTDVEHSFRLVSRLPKDKVLVSESGISQPQTVRSLREAGFRGFLMGEAFMKTDNPGAALSGFIKQLRP